MSDPAPTDPPRPEFRRYVWQRRWFQTLLAALVIFLVLSYVVPGVLGMLYAVRSVLVPVLIGLGLAYIVNPVLRFAELRLRIGRLAGTVSLMLLSLVGVAIILVTAVPTIYHQGRELVDTIQNAQYVDSLLSLIEFSEEDAKEAQPLDTHATQTIEAQEPAPQADGQEIAAAAEARTGEDTEARGQADPSLIDKFIDPDRIRSLMEIGVERLQGLDGAVMAGWAMQSLGLVGSAIGFTSYLALSAVVVAFCFFFFSWKFDAILKWFEPFIPRSHHELTLDMLKKMDLAVSSFVRGRVIQSSVMMVLLIVGWWWFEVPYWFLLGVATGLMNLVPFLPAVGWILSLVLAVITTLGNGGDFTLALVLWPSVVYFAAQSLDGWVIEPVVQGQATNLDPLSVMLVVLIGGTLAGLLGMLLAIPLAACVKILSKEWLLPKLRGVAAQA